MQIVVDLSGTLTTADDGNVVRGHIVSQHLGQVSAVLGGVHDAGILGETRRHLSLATKGNDDLAGVAGGDLASTGVARDDGKKVNNTTGIGGTGDDLDDLLAVVDDVVKVQGTPAHVVLKLYTGRQERAQIGEVDETLLVVEVVEESEGAAGIAHSSQILHEGDLHTRARNQHTRVPGKLILLLQEADLGLEVGVLQGTEGRVHSVVQGNGDSERRRAESHTEQIVHLPGASWSQQRPSCLGLGTWHHIEEGELLAGDRLHDDSRVFRVKGKDKKRLISMCMYRPPEREIPELQG